jgi:hypothetical protein
VELRRVRVRVRVRRGGRPRGRGRHAPRRAARRLPGGRREDARCAVARAEARGEATTIGTFGSSRKRRLFSVVEVIVCSHLIHATPG